MTSQIPLWQNRAKSDFDFLIFSEIKKEYSMNAAELVTELGTKLGISLSLGESGACRVYVKYYEEDLRILS